MRIKKVLLVLVILIILLGFFFSPIIFSTWNVARIIFLQTLLALVGLICALILLNMIYPAHITLFIKISVIITLLLIARVFLFYAGGPVSWDELYYMYISMFPSKRSNVLNRYFHIYLQRFFFFLAGWDPFTGARNFWTFCITATAGFTFINSYLLISSKKESIRIASGILSILIYFAYPYILDCPGVTFVDYTSMLLASIFIFLYLLARRNPKNIYLLLLGLLFFFSLKTKEVGICLIVFLFDKNLYNQKRNLLRSIVYFGMGFLCAAFIIALNDYFLLGDFLYSFRISSWQVLFSFNTRGRDLYEVIDILGALSRSGVLYLLFFTLYVLHGLAKDRHLEPSHHFLWIYVVTVLIFHLLSTMSGALKIEIRYFIVLGPALAALCAQIVYLLEEKIGRKWILKMILWGLICFIVIINIDYVAGYLGWQKDLFTERIFIPMFILALLVLFFQDHDWAKFIQLGLFVLVILSFFPGKFVALHNRYIENAFISRFQPLVDNAEALTYTPEMKLFVSSDVYNSHRILGRDRDSNEWMYALMFRQEVKIDQFVSTDFEPENFMEETYTSAFLSDADWGSLNVVQKTAIGSEYSISELGKYIFLSRK